MAVLSRLARPLALALALTSLAAPALADGETNCHRDSGGRLICVKVEREKAEKCTLTCRKDSGGRTVCRERCR
jgi:hypothetical protein